VLDLTRVIAGPVCGRTLAAHGADVLRVGAAHLPSIPALVIDTGFGKRSTHLDLRTASGGEVLAALVDDADVFVQGYRPGSLASLGFGPEQLAERRPGIVVVSLSAWGRVGPWAGRRGFDSLVQTASGIVDAGAKAFGVDRPAPLPAQALDHASGYLMAFGAAVALDRRVTIGGSWHVQVSLARTGRWITDLGQVDATALPDPGHDDVADLLDTMPSSFGRLTFVRPVAGRWDRPPVPLGTDDPAWI
jgi:crotonobetainyl-CoA:carnitine CoA-transferase CaiB-like acyl-CoA transferase